MVRLPNGICPWHLVSIGKVRKRCWGFEEAIHAAYPQTQVQQCIVHQVRHSLRFVPWKARKVVAADLRSIYRAAIEAAARLALHDFEINGVQAIPVLRLAGVITGHV